METFFSALLYLLVFVSSFSIFLFDEKYIRPNYRKLLHFLTISLAIFIPSFFAGIRGLNVGSDTSGYGFSIFQRCLLTPDGGFPVLYNELYSNETPIEFGYLLLVFFISRFSSHIFWDFFIVSYLSFLFFYLAFKRFSKIIPINIPLAMILLFFFFYNESLNLMRQTLAAGIAFFSFSFLFRKRFFYFFLFFIVSLSFHRMAIITIIYPLFFLILRLFKKKRWKEEILYILIVFLSVFILLTLKQIVHLLIDLNLISSHYYGYVESGGASLYFKGLLLRIPLLIVFIENYRKVFTKSEISKTFFAVFLTEMVLINSYSFSPWAYRIYSYLTYSKIFLLSQHSLFITKTKSKQLTFNLNNSFPLLYSFIWWVYYSAILNANNTFPFSINL
jgi:hypothetical protein